MCDANPLLKQFVFHTIAVHDETGDKYKFYHLLPETAETSEPFVMLLLGSGLIGLVGYGGRKFLKK